MVPKNNQRACFQHDIWNWVLHFRLKTEISEVRSSGSGRLCNFTSLLGATSEVRDFGREDNLIAFILLFILLLICDHWFPFIHLDIIIFYLFKRMGFWEAQLWRGQSWYFSPHQLLPLIPRELQHFGKSLQNRSIILIKFCPFKSEASMRNALHL